MPNYSECIEEYIILLHITELVQFEAVTRIILPSRRHVPHFQEVLNYFITNDTLTIGNMGVYYFYKLIKDVLITVIYWKYFVKKRAVTSKKCGTVNIGSVRAFSKDIVTI